MGVLASENQMRLFIFIFIFATCMAMSCTADSTIYSKKEHKPILIIRFGHKLPQKREYARYIDFMLKRLSESVQPISFEILCVIPENMSKTTEEELQRTIKYIEAEIKKSKINLADIRTSIIRQTSDEHRAIKIFAHLG